MSDEVIARMRRELAGREGVRREPIELGRVRDFLLAMDEPAEIEAGDPVPALFLLTLARTRRPQPSRGSAVKVGDELTLHAPVRVGDEIESTVRLAGIEHREGRRGPTYTYALETTYRNQRGELVGVGVARSMRWGQ